MSEELQEIINNNPEWYKCLQYKDAKGFIRDNINSASRSFVAIGYYLKYVRDNQLYKEDGYTGVSEFAKSEFGISPAQASKLMSINDRFSKDGNSPVLLEQYKDFSSSKLSEMLYLTDEQLEQVTITTTKAEIREIGKPVKPIEVNSFSPAKTEPTEQYYQCATYQRNQYTTGCKDCLYDKADCPYDRSGYFEKLKQQEKWRVHCEVLKEMCNTICHMYSYYLENNNYSMAAIQSISRKDQSFSFGFGDDGTGHSKYDARYMTRENRYCVKELHGEGMWMFEAGEVDQQIWNFNGREWHNNQQKSEPFKLITIDDLNLSVMAYNALKKHGIDTIYQLCEHTEKELLEEWKIGSFYTKQIIEKLGEIDKYLKADDIPEAVNDEPEIVDNEPEKVNDVDENVIETSEIVIEDPETVTEELETVEADIIQTEQDEYPKPIFSAKYHLKEAIKREEDQIEQLRDAWIKNNPDALLKHETILLALKLHLTDMEYPDPVPVKQEQPELPILKNNDQRKEFIEAYDTWPIWIDTKPTKERYYRYDFDNGSYIVVKVYFQKGYSWGELKNKDHWGSNEYYLIKAQGSHFKDCQTNMTALIEYLKDIQKK